MFIHQRAVREAKQSRQQVTQKEKTTKTRKNTENTRNCAAGGLCPEDTYWKQTITKQGSRRKTRSKTDNSVKRTVQKRTAYLLFLTTFPRPRRKTSRGEGKEWRRNDKHCVQGLLSAVQKLQYPEDGLQNVFNTALSLFCELWCVIIPTCFCTTVSACRVLGFLSHIHTLLRSSAQLHAAEASLCKHYNGVSYVHLYSVSMCDFHVNKNTTGCN